LLDVSEGVIAAENDDDALRDCRLLDAELSLEIVVLVIEVLTVGEEEVRVAVSEVVVTVGAAAADTQRPARRVITRPSAAAPQGKVELRADKAVGKVPTRIQDIHLDFYSIK
jgi:hypothetical protein